MRGAPLNLRAGAGTEFRILATVASGEPVEVLERSEKWTRVRKRDGKVGWIAAGYLEQTAPPSLRVEELGGELEGTQAELEKVTGELERLREAHGQLTDSDSARAEEMRRLERENLELRAGAAWPERIVGALIFVTGMALGALLRRRRRQTSKIRL